MTALRTKQKPREPLNIAGESRSLHGVAEQVELRTWGRFGLRVTLEDGIVVGWDDKC
jgi:hypothetical protein